MKEHNEQIVLKELLKYSRGSDRELAKRLGLSQPTVSRIRTRLEKDGLIQTYTVIPDFARLGYQMLAFTFIKLKSFPSREESKKIAATATEWLSNRHNVIFAADGEGLGGKDIVMVSFHKSYARYSDFMRIFAMDWGHMIGTFETYTVGLESGFKFKTLDLKYLAEDE